MAFQNCWVCVDTIVGVGTSGLDSGLVGRANGNVEMVLNWFVWSKCDVQIIFFSHFVMEPKFSDY